uniref:Uncharacterized protein n=1 Tax=Opuntia streptacantha TaxID=393608 RepID=A0A7C9AJV6_OPUST
MIFPSRVSYLIEHMPVLVTVVLVIDQTSINDSSVDSVKIRLVSRLKKIYGGILRSMLFLHGLAPFLFYFFFSWSRDLNLSEFGLSMCFNSIYFESNSLKFNDRKDRPTMIDFVSLFFY